MNSPERISLHHTNGHATTSSNGHAERPRHDSVERPVAPAASNAATANSGTMGEALSRTRESLTALQQLAERTAELHRQFLEGQEKTQATFLLLLEEQLRLSGAGVVASGATARRATPGPINHERVRPEFRNGDAADRPNGHLVSPVEEPHRNGDWAGHDHRAQPIEHAEFVRDVARPEPVAEGWGRVEPEVIPVPRAATMAEEPAPVGAERVTVASIPAAAPVAATSGATAGMAEIVLEVIAEKTGYPAEALELDQQLDADLGIDSIKRVEIFSALQDRFAGLRPLGPEELASLRTLRAIVEFLAAVPGASVPAATVNPAPPSDAVSVPTADSARRAELTETLLETVAEKTGYPSEMLELEMRLDADLGIDSIKRVEIFSALQDRITGAPAVGPEMIGRLTTLGEVVAFLEGSGGVADAAVSSSAAIETAQAELVALASSPEQASVAKILLETVAEKTGYPSEMLELEMRLDADLGIDSIKRVEIFSALQDRLSAANAIGPDQIGTLATLGDIVAFLSQAQVASPAPVAVKIEPVMTGVGAASDLGGRAVSDRGRALLGEEYRPQPPLAHFSNLQNTDVDPPGVQSRADAARNGHAESVKREANQRPVPLGQPLDVQELRAVGLANQGRREANRLPAGGVIWVTDDGSTLAGLVGEELRGRGFDARVVRMTDATPLTAERDRPCGLVLLHAHTGSRKGTVLDAFRVVRAAGPWLDKAGQNGGASLVTVARLDGAFGVGGGLSTATRPDSGVLAGMAKTAGHEWASVDCKALDLDARFDDLDRGAKWIVEELLHQGPSEVGLSARGRVGLELVRLQAERGDVSKKRRLQAADVVVVSGGARGVTAEVAVAIAERYRCTMVVLGRTPEPAEESAELAGCTDETELRRVLMRVAGAGASPQMIGRHAKEVLAHREIRQNLARIKAAGASVSYRQVDVRDRGAVAGIIGEVEEQFGPVRGLVHGAGVLADRKILDQTDEQFSSVYETKVDGLENLFRAIDPSGLAVVVLFSSSTARFGRVGQVAYAAANEYLNKWAQRQAVLLPECRVVSLNWGPWAGGMVTDGLKKLFESEGVGLIELASGAKLVVDEIERQQSRPVEIVVLAELKTVSANGTPAGRDAAGKASLDTNPHGEAAGKTSHEPRLDAVIRKTVSVKAIPVLKDHVINSHAVVPMALVMEWLGEAAVQRNPGLSLLGLSDCRLFKGVTLEATERVELSMAVGRAVRDGSGFVVAVELRGELPNGRAVVHARTEVILGERHASGERRIEDRRMDAVSVDSESIYRDMLFHGPGLQAIHRVLGCDAQGIAGVVASGAKVSEWVDRPTRNEWLTDPLAIDAAFQLMIVWTREQLGTNSLPVGMAGYEQFTRRFPSGGVRVVARVSRTDGSRVTADLEFVDQAGRLVARIEGYECVCDASLNDSFRRNQLPTAAMLLATS